MITIDQYSDFFSRYNRNLVNFAQAYLRNREQAEDCAMDACMKMWERRAEIVAKGDDDLLRWTLTVLRNQCINILRRQKLMVTDSSDEAWTLGERILGLESFEPQDICFSEIHGIVTEALQRMPNRTREVFLTVQVATTPTMRSLPGTISQRVVWSTIFIRLAAYCAMPLAIMLLRLFSLWDFCIDCKDKLF